MEMSVFVLLTLIFSSCSITGVHSSANFTFANRCDFTVWPGILTTKRSDNRTGIHSTGFTLQSGESEIVSAFGSWAGRIWGRTGCREDSNGSFHCVTGDCGTGKMECAGNRNVPTVTLAEFNLNAINGMDLYDVSLVFGYNLPILVAPLAGSGADCRTTECVRDVNRACPVEMRVTGSNGEAIACKSACQAFLVEQYCCNLSSPSECKPTEYSRVFKRECPQAYSYVFDSDYPTYTCTGANYNITFCPSGSPKLPLTPGSSPPFFTPGSSPPSSGMKRDAIIILVVVFSVVLIVFVIVLIIVRKIKQVRRDKQLRELLTLEGYEEREAKNQDLRFFTYESILSATNSFSMENKLGEGGFGSVYKGITSSGQDIAVKLLSQQSGQGLLEFKTELILISKLQHVNLVKLHGLCIHGNNKMIIYDYMPNRSLDFFLFSSTMSEQLSWQQRFSIVEGIAQGLLYLHKYSRLRIIHRDLKASNVLLDEKMNAKISDFGLARVFEQNIDEANTNRRVGTYGYMAPEYAMQGIISVKSDVYSFGVLVLEIVSGRKNNSFHQIEGPLSLVEYAWEVWRKDCALELMDPVLKDSCVTNQLQRCIHIALLCVENRVADRPTSEDVVMMLKSETTNLPIPKNPSFVARNNVFGEVKKSTTDTTSSINEVTLSERFGFKHRSIDANKVVATSRVQVEFYRTPFKLDDIHFSCLHIVTRLRRLSTLKFRAIPAISINGLHKT
ncbi:PR5-like receptor kinase isoform X2 [Andrographis paniculata]|uniref:PR5-like receptor kinase isoform X2 n=1 Tax=Andrographis paniculata TaxID=175694 RepID=UPI0021E94358|nr:PR5-like receptor kinase isoform X2 [Andrographis paniculata]